MQQKKVSVPVPYSKCVFHRVGGDGGSSQGQDIALALPLPLISLAEVVSDPITFSGRFSRFDAFFHASRGLDSCGEVHERGGVLCARVAVCPRE